MKNKTYRHGDITLVPAEKLEGREIKNNGTFVLAEGETTGHKHVFTAERMEIREKDGRFYIQIPKIGKIVHEEHKTITVDPGIYEVIHEREMNWFEKSVKRVVD